MDKDEEKLEKAQFFFKLSLESDKILQHSNELLTEKIRGVFAVTSAIIPIVVGLGYFILKETNAHWIFIPIFASLLMFLVAIAIGVYLHKPTNFKVVNPEVIICKHKHKSLRYVINKSASTWADVVSHNRSVINSKEMSLNLMLIFLTLGLVILAVTFILLGVSFRIN